MGMKFGEIDTDQVLHNEWRIGVLESLFDKLIQKHPNLRFTKEEIDEINVKVVKDMQKKYPKSGIELNRKINTNE